MDDELFCMVFDGDIECAQYVLRIILDNEHLVVKSSVVQKTELNTKGRGVRFDVLAESDGVLYDIEVQRSNEGAKPRRARYNSSMLDVHTLNRGADFNELVETYVIFITENDVLKKNLPIYHIHRRIDETGDLFDDGTHIIYVNGTNRDDTALGRLMRDFTGRNMDQIQESILKKRVKKFKDPNKGGVYVMSIMQDLYDQASKESFEKGHEVGHEEGREIGRQEGIEIGIEKNKIVTVINLLKLNQSVDIIARAVEMPADKIIAIGKEHGLV